ncbi:41920_t:CDS:2, partial [Gigaspora margarita]
SCNLWDLPNIMFLKILLEEIFVGLDEIECSSDIGGSIMLQEGKFVIVDPNIQKDILLSSDSDLESKLSIS